MHMRIPAFVTMMLLGLLTLPSCSGPVSTPPAKKPEAQQTKPETKPATPAPKPGLGQSDVTPGAPDAGGKPVAKPDAEKASRDALDDLLAPVEKPAKDGPQPKAKPKDAPADPFSLRSPPWRTPAA